GAQGRRATHCFGISRRCGSEFGQKRIQRIEDLADPRGAKRLDLDTAVDLAVPRWLDHGQWRVDRHLVPLLTLLIRHVSRPGKARSVTTAGSNKHAVINKAAQYAADKRDRSVSAVHHLHGLQIEGDIVATAGGPLRGWGDAGRR